MTKLTHLEVQNALLKDGVDGIKKIIDEASASAHTLRRALRELKENPGNAAKQTKAFEQLLDAGGFLSSPLTKPDVGDRRGYKIQEEGGRQIIKVPVDYLQQKTGSELNVSFDVNGFRGILPEEER